MLIFNLEPVLNDIFISINLYENVANADEIKHQVADGKINAAVLKPNLILDVFQLLVATNKAFFLKSQSKLKTRNVFSEILFNLSPSNQISECFKLFGVNESTKTFIVICLKDDFDHIHKLVDGDTADLSLLANNCDKSAITKLYKINEMELETSTLLDCVVSQLASKDIR